MPNLIQIGRSVRRLRRLQFVHIHQFKCHRRGSNPSPSVVSHKTYHYSNLPVGIRGIDSPSYIRLYSSPISLHLQQAISFSLLQGFAGSPCSFLLCNEAAAAWQRTSRLRDFFPFAGSCWLAIRRISMATCQHSNPPFIPILLFVH